MRHRLSGEYTSVGNLKMDWGQGRRKGVLGVLIERLFFIASVQAGRNVHCDSNCLKSPSIATIVSQATIPLSCNLLI